MLRCQFEVSWHGQCARSVEDGFEYCEDHLKEKCWQCGGQACEDCDWAGQLVCGMPQCGQHPHQSSHVRKEPLTLPSLSKSIRVKEWTRLPFVLWSGEVGDRWFRVVLVDKDKVVCEQMSGRDAMDGINWKQETNVYALEKCILDQAIPFGSHYYGIDSKALTRSPDETVIERIRRDPEFAVACYLSLHEELLNVFVDKSVHPQNKEGPEGAS